MRLWAGPTAPVLHPCPMEGTLHSEGDLQACPRELRCPGRNSLAGATLLLFPPPTPLLLTLSGRSLECPPVPTSPCLWERQVLKQAHGCRGREGEERMLKEENGRWRGGGTDSHLQTPPHWLGEESRKAAVGWGGEMQGRAPRGRRRLHHLLLTKPSVPMLLVPTRGG